MPSSEIISQLSDLKGAIQEDSLVLLSDTGHNSIYRYVKSGRIFAIKAVKPTCKDSELYQQFLYREYQLLSNLQSPFIVSVWQMTSLPEIGECMMMEYIDGRTWDRFVEERPSAALRSQVLDELLQAIDYLHRKQIVHADLKPQNILITNNGNHVKLIDLGLADSDSWRENNIGNTRQYAAPEYANQIFLAYRDSSTAYMYCEINRYPDHNMEIARIYDYADRHIFSPPVLKVINNLPSKAFADEHPDIQVPKSYQDVLDSIRNEVEMLYNRFADSAMVWGLKLRLNEMHKHIFVTP